LQKISGGKKALKSVPVLGGLAAAQHTVGSLYLAGVPDPDSPNKWLVEKSLSMAKQYFEMASNRINSIKTLF
jgi:hypothetical protein